MGHPAYPKVADVLSWFDVIGADKQRGIRDEVLLARGNGWRKCCWLDDIQPATSLMHVSMRSMRDSIGRESQNPYIFVLSAYRCACRPCPSISQMRSTVYNGNSMGPRTEPCRSLHSSTDSAELQPLNRTYYIRCSRYVGNHFRTGVEWMP